MGNVNIVEWSKGIAYEIAFWNNVYRWNHTFQGMMDWSNYNKVINLEGFDANQYLSSLDNPVVLDVGCGMSYATGNYICRGDSKQLLDIHYIDPLANYFNRILHKYHKQLPEIEFGMIEYLSAFYTQHDVDLVMVQNALDHSANPIKGIYEALDILRINGILYLNHHVNEAETEHYKGFHKYNICQEGDNLIIWNKSERWNINELLAPIADVKVSFENNRHVVAVITKKATINTSLLSDKADIKQLCKVVMQQSMWQRNISTSVKLKMEYWKFNIIQFFAQSLPHSMKMRIKRFIKQA